ncbi:MAG: bifunctional diguanylate cyclase/phosphodiesterase [Wenzhouxiangella sp.]
MGQSNLLMTDIAIGETARFLFEHWGPGNFGFWQWDVARDQIHLDPRCLALLGLSAQDAPQSTADWLDRCHPEDTDAYGQALAACQKPGIDEYRFEVRLRHSEGHYLPMLDRGRVAERDETGQPRWILGILAHLTDSDKASQHPGSEAAFLKSLLNANASGITVLNEEGRIIFANREAERLFELPADALTERGFADEAWQITDLDGHPLDADQLPFAQVRKTGKPVRDFRHAIVWPDGQRRYLSINAAPVLATRRLGGSVVCMVTDITDKVIEEREAHYRQQLLDGLFQKSPIGIVLARRSTRCFEAANPAYLNMVGYTADELIGHPVETTTPINNDWRTQRAMSEVSEMGYYRSFERNLVCKDGSLKPVMLSGNLIKDRNGEELVWSFVEDLSRRKAFEETITRQTRFDTLTGLANRDYFEQQLAQAIRAGTPMAVIMLDLDLFKTINDSMGHRAGDQILQMMAERLENAIVPDGTVARFGGDEFLFMVPLDPIDRELSEVCQALLAAVSAPFELDQQQISLTASLGASRFPEDGATVEDLMQSSDLAMFAAKTAGRKQARFYCREYRQMADERLRKQQALRRAIAQSEFVFHYQPIIDLGTGQVDKVEALIRWRQPDGTLLAPLHFIPLAESLGIIDEISCWAYDEALAQCQRWRDNGLNLQLSINLTGQCLKSEQLIERLLQDRQSGEPCRPLVIELTESQLIFDRKEDFASLQDLVNRGYELAIDDFGTGYSSLNYLAEMPARFLKIDRSFTNSMHVGKRLSLTRGIVSIARELGLKVIAEGVETAAQLQLLMAMRCDYAQGYLLSRPLPEDEIMRFLERFDLGSHLADQPRFE